MNNSILIAIGLVLVVGGGYYVISNKNTEVAPVTVQKVSETPKVDVAANADTVSFTVEGSNTKFAPTNLTVKKGQKVKLTFKNVEGFHDWKIDAFNAFTSKIKGGAEETIEFVVDKAGSFEYYCSVGSHRAMGMVGTLVVTE